MNRAGLVLGAVGVGVVTAARATARRRGAIDLRGRVVLITVRSKQVRDGRILGRSPRRGRAGRRSRRHGVAPAATIRLLTQAKRLLLPSSGATSGAASRGSDIEPHAPGAVAALTRLARVAARRLGGSARRRPLTP